MGTCTYIREWSLTVVLPPPVVPSMSKLPDPVRVM